MEYGQTKHDLDEEEELEEKVEETIEDMGKFPHKISSKLPAVGFGVKIPDTMARLNNMNIDLTIKVPDTSNYHPAHIHDSTPWKTYIPKTPLRISVGHNPMSILEKKKKKN